jgi:hypothetical protein
LQFYLSSSVTAALFDMHLYIHLYLQVEDLARLSFKNKPLYVGVDDSRTTATLRAWGSCLTLT